MISVVAEPKKKWVHITGTADLRKLIHAIEKKGRKVEVIYYCKTNISDCDEPTKEDRRHDRTKDGAEKHYSSSTTKSTGKNSFHHDKDFGYEDSDEGNGNDEYEDPHARYKTRVHKRESYSAASRAAAPPPPPPSREPHMRGFGDDFMDPDVAYHLRIMRSTVPQPMCHTGYMYVQPPCYGGGSGGYYGGGTYPASYQAAPRPYHQYGYSPYYHG